MVKSRTFFTEDLETAFCIRTEEPGLTLETLQVPALRNLQDAERPLQFFYG